MAEGATEAHVRYMEQEILKMDARASRLEQAAADLKTENARRAARDLAGRLREELGEYRKYLSVMKPK